MGEPPVSVTVYHNPACGTSRNTIGLIRNAGIEPTIVEYLKTPPDRATLKSLLERMGMGLANCCGKKAHPMQSWGWTRSTGRTSSCWSR